VVTAVLLAFAVGPVATATAGPAHAGASGRDLPPAKFAALERLFRKQLAPLGVQMSRALLQDIESYERSAAGTHLALYVEPLDTGYTDAQYVENFTRLTRRFVPAVFKRWKGLESFDICQEPAGDPRKSPPSVTQIFVSRDGLDRVDSWRTADLTELIAASPRTRNVDAGYYVYFDPRLADEPTLVAAAQQAGWPLTSDTTPGS
jgi:hypothetical protein